MKRYLYIDSNEEMGQILQKKYKNNAQLEMVPVRTLDSARDKIINDFQKFTRYDGAIVDVRAAKNNQLSATAALPAVSFLKSLKDYGIRQVIAIVSFQEVFQMDKIRRHADQVVLKGIDFFKNLDEILYNLEIEHTRTERLEPGKKECTLNLSFGEDNTLTCILQSSSAKDLFIPRTMKVRPDSAWLGALRQIPDNHFAGDKTWSAELQQLGINLWRMLECNPSFTEAYRTATSLAPDDQIKVVIQSESDLFQYPLELANSQGMDYWLFKHPIVRQLHPARLQKQRPPINLAEHNSSNQLRVLLVPVSAKGTVLIGSDSYDYREIQGVRNETRDIMELMSRHPAFSVKVLPDPVTIENLQLTLQSWDFDLVHFACHGEHFTTEPGCSCVMLADSKAPQILKSVNTIALTSWLKEAKVRFVYLSCCHGADYTPPPPGDYFGGLMDSLAREGIPTVIGFRWPLIDEFGNSFAKIFYDEWLRSYDIGYAVYQARRRTKPDVLLSHYCWAGSVVVGGALPPQLV